MEDFRPVSCFYCSSMIRDMRPYVERRFWCGQMPEERRRVTTIYSSAGIPVECPIYKTKGV